MLYTEATFSRIPPTFIYHQSQSVYPSIRHSFILCLICLCVQHNTCLLCVLLQAIHSFPLSLSLSLSLFLCVQLCAICPSTHFLFLSLICLCVQHMLACHVSFCLSGLFSSPSGRSKITRRDLNNLWFPTLSILEIKMVFWTAFIAKASIMDSSSSFSAVGFRFNS